MKKNLFLSCLLAPAFLFNVVTMQAQCEGPAGQDPTKWERTFTEEFNGTSLNTNVWNNHVWYENPDPVINYAVENGVLKIWPDQGFKNRTIDTDGKYYQTYGFYEVDAKLNIGKGCWPAFWLFNHIGADRPEMDVMEAYPGGGPSSGWGDANLHPVAYAVTVWRGSGPTLVGTKTMNTVDLSAAFHKYGVLWEPNKQTYYFDGNPVYVLNTSFPDPMYLMLDLWFGSASGTPNTSETPMGKGNSYEVNYVRAWKSGVCSSGPPTPIAVCTPQQSPVVDGIAENTWTNITSNALSNPYTISGSISSTADLSASYKTTWDNTNLYLLVNVKDDILINDSGINTWDDDGIEVFIDGNNEKAVTYDANDHQFIFRVNDATVYYYKNGVAQTANPAGVTFSQGTNTGGYLMEIQIPWTAIGVTAAQGKLLGFDIHVNDDDDNGAADAKLMWYATGPGSAQNPSTFGALELKSTSCPAPPPAPQAVCTSTQSPVIDGADEPAWAGISANPIAKPLNLAGTISSTSDLSADYKATWDNTSLYLLVKVKDDVLINDSGTNTWDDDGIEIFIDGNNDKATTYDANDHQFIFRVNDATVNYYINGVAQAANPAGVTFSQGANPGGYLMEIKILWTALGVISVNGKLLGLDIHVNDDDDNGTADAKLMWFATGGGSATDPSKFGTIKLDNTSCGGVTTGIAEEKNKNSITVYPNPFNTNFTLEISSEIIIRNAAMKIYDVCGKVVKIFSINDYKTIINRDELENGIYFYELINNYEKIINGKLIIQ